jgi:Mrp family chromosome partitioning ATPase
MRPPAEPSALEPSLRPNAFDARPAMGLLASIRAHPVLIAVLTLQVALVALIWSGARAPVYKASAQVLVTPLPEDADPRLPVLRTSSDRTRVIETAANLLDSTAAASATARRLGAGWDAARVDAMVDVLPEGQSDVLSVTAKADDPALAATLANEYARAALRARGRVLTPVVASLIEQTSSELRAEPHTSSPVALDLAERLSQLRAIGTGVDPTMALTRTAEPPDSPVGAPRSLLLIAGLLAGLAVGIGSALVLDTLGAPRITDATHATAATGLPVLARVPGFSLWEKVQRTPVVRFRPRAAAGLRALQYQLDLQPGARRRLLLAGGSAGDGVTTTTAELGLMLARSGHSVLLIDIETRDPRLAERLGVTRWTVLTADSAAGDPWQGDLSTVPGVPSLKVVVTEALGSLGMPDDLAAELPRLLHDAQRRFDYVLVDAPPLAESGEALRIAQAVDAVVLVLRPGKTPLPDVELALDLLERIDKRPEGIVLVGGRAGSLTGDRAAAGSVAPQQVRGGASLQRRAEI